jgi:hypothetical protein
LSYTKAIGNKTSKWTPWKIEGEQKLIVLLVNIININNVKSVEEIKVKLEEMNTYFKRISHGKMYITYTITPSWKTPSHGIAYYGQDTPSTVSSDVRYNDVRKREFLSDSINAWDGEIDYTKYEHLIVIHAGEDQSFPYTNNKKTELLWRHDAGELPQPLAFGVLQPLGRDP